MDEQIQDVVVMIATTTQNIIFGIFLNATFLEAVASIAILFVVIMFLVMFFPKLMK